MGLVIKESLKSTVISFLGMILGAAMMILSVKYLSKPEFGVQQSILKAASLIGYIGVFGFDYSMMVMGQKYNADNEKRKSFLWYNLKWPLAFSIGLSIIIIAIKPWYISQLEPEQVPLMSVYFYSVPTLICLFVAMYWLSGYLKSVFKSTFVFLVVELLLRLLFLLILLLVALGWIDFHLFLILFVLSYTIPTLIMFIKARNVNGFKWHKGNKSEQLTKNERRSIFNFAFYHMFTILSGILVFQVDSLVLPVFLDDGFADLAVYALSVYAVSVIRTPARAVSAASIPVLAEYYNEGNFKKLKELFIRSALNLQLITFLLSVLLLINLPYIDLILNDFKSGYEMFAILVPILLVGVILEMSSGLNFEMISISKHYKLIFWVAALFILVTLVLFVTLVYHFGQLGAAWAFTSAMSIFTLSKAIIVYKLMDMNSISRQSIKAIFVTLICFAIGWYLPALGNPYLTILFKSVIVSVIFISLVLVLKIGEDVMHLFEKIKYRIFK